MKPNQLRNIMIGVFFASMLILVIASYALKNTPRQGGFVNSGPNGAGQKTKIEYYPTGELRAEGLMDGYYKEGKWTYYYKDGTIQLEEYYNKGIAVDAPIEE